MDIVFMEKKGEWRMSRLTDECDIKDTSILRKLILENQKLSELVSEDEEAYKEEYS